MDCNKKKFKTETDALVMASKFLRSKSYNGNTLRIYYCDECRAYHHTKNAKVRLINKRT